MTRVKSQINGNKQKEITGKVKSSINFKSLLSKRFLFIPVLIIAMACSGIFMLTMKTTYKASSLVFPMDLNQYRAAMDYSTGMLYNYVNDAYVIPLEAYPSVLRSPQIQMNVLKRAYEINSRASRYQMNLMEYFAREDLTYAFEELNRITEIETIANSSLIKLSVTTLYPELSRQIVDAYVEELNTFFHEWMTVDPNRKLFQIEDRVESLSQRANIKQENMQEKTPSYTDYQVAFSSKDARRGDRFGRIEESYTKASNNLLKTWAIAIPVVAGGIASLTLFVIFWQRKPSEIINETQTISRLTLKRGPEVAQPVVARKKPVRKRTRVKKETAKV